MYAKCDTNFFNKIIAAISNTCFIFILFSFGSSLIGTLLFELSASFARNKLQKKTMFENKQKVIKNKIRAKKKASYEEKKNAK